MVASLITILLFDECAVTIARNDTENGNTYSECGGVDDSDPVKIAIELEINKLPNEGLRLKKFRKAVMDQFPERAAEDLKTEFADMLDKFCSDGAVSLDGGILTRLVDQVTVSSNMNKRKSSQEQSEYPKEKIPRVDDDVAKKELWKYGEQLWADGALDSSYMTDNPDGITRLFCGNLKKEITEEQLRNAISGKCDVIYCIRFPFIFHVAALQV